MRPEQILREPGIQEAKLCRLIDQFIRRNRIEIGSDGRAAAADIAL